MGRKKKKEKKKDRRGRKGKERRDGATDQNSGTNNITQLCRSLSAAITSSNNFFLVSTSPSLLFECQETGRKVGKCKRKYVLRLVALLQDKVNKEGRMEVYLY